MEGKKGERDETKEGKKKKATTGVVAASRMTMRENLLPEIRKLSRVALLQLRT